MALTKPEVSQIIRWVLLWIGSWFVAYNLRIIIEKYIPNPVHQMLFGIAVLAFVGYWWNIMRYSGTDRNGRK